MALRILHRGWFLQEGFRQYDCDVTPLELDPSRTLNDLVTSSGCDPDLVCIELFGKTPLPRAIHASNYRLAAYCIDSPINAYWLMPLMRLFDLVYVDQLASVSLFKRHGILAKWLPLCVNDGHFRPETPKKHFLTFVGRITPHRPKRANLLRHIREHYDVNCVDNVTTEAMLDCFAASRVVLNENFFPGINLRFVHALASGSLLLTERQGHGLKHFFTEGRHYAGYGPQDAITTLKAIENDPGRFEEIARNGQQECRKHHTSVSRASVILADLTKPTQRTSCSLPDRAIYEAKAKYDHAIRFGGSFKESITLFTHAGEASVEARSLALCALGRIALHAGKETEGRACLDSCASFTTLHGCVAALQSLLLAPTQHEVARHIQQILPLLHHAPKDIARYKLAIECLQSQEDRRYHVCLLASHILFDLDHVAYLGFHKQAVETLPSCALEFALLAFDSKKTEASLEAVIRCMEKAGIAPEALPYIKAAILEGAASESQIALSVNLARAYYDFDYARSVATTLKHKPTKPDA